MQMVGAFAEFERAMLRERTKAGLSAAREEGRIGGRPPKLSPQQQSEIRKMVAKGDKTAADAARLFKVHPATVSRVMARASVAEGCPRQIACKVLRQIICKVAGSAGIDAATTQLRIIRPVHAASSAPPSRCTSLEVQITEYMEGYGFITEIRWRPVSVFVLIAAWRIRDLASLFGHPGAGIQVEEF